MNTADRMTCGEALDLAKRWAGKGMHAFPIAIGWDPKKQATNKRPLTADGGFYNATTDPAELERMFNTMSPRPGEVWGVGIWPGPSGHLVLDPDIKNGQHGDDELAALEAEHGPLDTLRAVTASGGGHVYLKKPPDVHIGNADLADGLEVRADAGYVVAIGTRTPWGSWEHDAVTPRTAVDCPQWLLDRLTSTNGHGGRKGKWSELDRSKLHPANLAALEALERLGGHDAFIGGDGSVLVTRPGKTAGASASIGHIGPGIVKVFTPNWRPLKQDAVYDPDWLTEIADAVEAGDRRLAEQVADPAYWNERLVRDPQEVAEAAAALDVTVVTIDQFAAVDEPGAEALLGDGGDAVIPAEGDVMVYGDGGAGKTTLAIDLACHLGAGDDWLGVTVTRPLTVLLVENEGPRPLFRAKANRKVKAWAGSPLGGRVRVVESPWATLSFAEETHRHALAQVIADHGCDLVMVGPLACSGMTEAGTLAEVRAFLALVDDVRRRSGRKVTFLTVHHPNRAGTPWRLGGGRRHPAPYHGHGPRPHPPSRPESPLVLHLARSDPRAQLD